MKLAHRLLAAGAMSRRRPLASSVAISGTPTEGETLTGSFVYSDPDGSPEGTSTFRWLRDAVAIGGATAITYVLVADDVGCVITFEVTPVSTTAPTTGLPVVSAGTAEVESGATLIESCDSGWTTNTGLMRAINSAPTAGGTGYTVGDILDVTEGVGGQVRVAAESAGVVTAVTLYAGGQGGYTSGAGKATTGGTGAGCTVNITTAGNASTTHSSSEKTEGTNSVRVACSGTLCPPRALLTYKAISPGDLSAFTRLVVDLFNAAALGGDEFDICLCSDTVGRVPVDRFTFPALVPEDAFTTHTITRAGGGTLMAACASIGIYSLSGPPSSGFYYFDNIRVAA